MPVVAKPDSPRQYASPLPPPPPTSAAPPDPMLQCRRLSPARADQGGVAFAPSPSAQSESAVLPVPAPLQPVQSPRMHSPAVPLPVQPLPVQPLPVQPPQQRQPTPAWEHGDRRSSAPRSSRSSELAAHTPSSHTQASAPTASRQGPGPAPPGAVGPTSPTRALVDIRIRRADGSQCQLLFNPRQASSPAVTDHPRQASSPAVTDHPRQAPAITANPAQPKGQQPAPSPTDDPAREQLSDIDRQLDVLHERWARSGGSPADCSALRDLCVRREEVAARLTGGERQPATAPAVTPRNAAPQDVVAAARAAEEVWEHYGVRAPAMRCPWRQTQSRAGHVETPVSPYWQVAPLARPVAALPAAPPEGSHKMPPAPTPAPPSAGSPGASVKMLGPPPAYTAAATASVMPPSPSSPGTRRRRRRRRHDSSSRPPALAPVDTPSVGAPLIGSPKGSRTASAVRQAVGSPKVPQSPPLSASAGGASISASVRPPPHSLSEMPVKRPPDAAGGGMVRTPALTYGR
eukprot:TRINITY_DN6349_c0_g1_i1.p2 TRINITY_DN6349_c0_g1~~TRINITY_DN6349_c0_g1_i1.p2  ORF type:complete len:535 (+),score=172.19 TRINITY_DN6349_c0_g1_i1:56-1606(+)